MLHSKVSNLNLWCMRTKNFTQSLKIILGMIVCSGLASAQGTQQEITYESTYGNGQSFGYLEYLPVDYATSEEKFPLLISLHGLGWRANGDGIEFSKLRKGNHVAKRIEAGEHFPAIVISPQQPMDVTGRYSGRGSWDASIIDEVLERVKGLRRVDADRIYITGTSMGGGGVWLYLRSHGDKIAAAAPVCATQTIGSNDTKSSKIKDTPVWAFHNYGDNVVNRSSTENIMKWIDTNNPDNQNRKTIYAWSGHNSWDATYSGSGRDTTTSSHNQVEYGTNTNQPDVFEWMFAHNLRAPYPVRASVSDDHPNQLLVAFNQPVAQASADGFRLEGTSVGLAALSSGLGSTQLLFTLSGEVQVGEIVSLYYDDQPGVLANSAGIRTNEFEDLKVENTVGFMKLQADDIAVDFGDGSQPCPTGWNQQTAHQQGASLNNLKSVAGVSSNLLIRTLTSFPGSYDDGTVTGGNSGVFPDEVMKTFWTVGSETEQLSVEGLAANQTYNFHFFSSRSSSGGTRLTEYAVQGETVTLDAKMNISRVAKITGISPDPSGKVVISMRLPEGSEYGYLNALVIRAAGETSVEPVNVAPVVTTCADTLLRLPVNQVLLKGQAEDPDGTIVSYGWMQTTGPTPAQLSGTDTKEITISEIAAGDYAFQFSATDNQGATSSQEVLVTVEPQNAAPVANAGEDQEITLPSDSVLLAGTATDADGGITSYQWTQMAGPSAAMITQATSETTWVSDLAVGQYVFALEVTDNEGLTANDEVRLNVRENQLPTVSIANVAPVYLPENSITLSAQAEDADGAIAAINWTQKSGPTTAELANVASLTLSVDALVAGSYVFEISVQDDHGHAGSDSVMVEVVPEPAPTPPSPAPSPSPSPSPSPAPSPSENNYIAGLTYHYYEGPWSTLPNFASLAPVKAGTVEKFTLSPREQNSDFAFTFDGFVDIATEGTYTFYTASDDGSKLYINGQAVVDNDGLHGKREEAGQVHLTVGKHAIRVAFFERSGNEILEVRYQGPGVSKQLIPSEVVYHLSEDESTPSVDPTAGLVYHYYEGNWNILPDFTSLVPVKTGTVENFTLSPREKDVTFAFTFDGFIDITTEGMYTFYTASDDGSKLYINGQTVVDNDGLHGKEEKLGQVHLTAGKHAIRVVFFEKWGSEILEVSYQGPGVPKQFVPSAVLSQSNENVNARLLTLNKVGSAESEAQELGLEGDIAVQTFPNPVRNVLHIALGEARPVKITFIDNYGNAIHTLETTEQQVSINLRELRIKNGIFMLTIVDTEENRLLCSRKLIRH